MLWYVKVMWSSSRFTATSQKQCELNRRYSMLQYIDFMRWVDSRRGNESVCPCSFECSWCKCGCCTEGRRGRTGVAHWLSLPLPCGKKPPELHEGSSDPTAAPLESEEQMRPTRHIVCASRKSVLCGRGFFNDTKVLLSQLTIMDEEQSSFESARFPTISFHHLFVQISASSRRICTHPWFSLLITDAYNFFFFFTLTRRFSQHLRESTDYPHVGNKEVISAAIKGAQCFSMCSATFQS